MNYKIKRREGNRAIITNTKSGMDHKAVLFAEGTKALLTNYGRLGNRIITKRVNLI